VKDLYDKSACLLIQSYECY